ncbi:MAG: bacillithiol biosynthesis deacetylase BshB1 [Nitrospinae bacterium]|nr:bacillithiol biosynthesis deacetylase BshB1 [Nitrospinota bacterium]
MVNVLAVGTHPDDIELGAAGTIASLVRQGKNVAVLDLTSGEPTPHGTPELRRKETENANAILGITQRITLDLPNRWLMDTREARVKVAEEYRLLRPEVLLLPYWEDAHPDHVQASQIAQAARFIAKYTKTEMAGEPYYPPRVFFYFCIHLKKLIEPTFIFDISDAFDQKREAVRAYHSQFFAGGKERGDEILRRLEAQAVHYGGLIGARYGEPFFSQENIGVRAFDAFLP